MSQPTLTRDAAQTAPCRPRASWGMRALSLGAVIIPFIGFVIALVLLWGFAVNGLHLTLLTGFYLLCGFGVTVGFHRLFTHRSFTTVRPVRWALAIMGSMAVQGPLLKWVAQHRKHHQLSDHEGDPHSPHLHGGRWWQMLHGFWHAHTGWIFDGDSPDLNRYVGDLRKDRGLTVISRLFVLWVALGLLLPAAVGGLLGGSWKGVLLGFIWGGLARIFLLHHVTWSINSVCHLWGSRPFRSDDQSRNNVIFGVLAMGEGWHNNHHAFPTSARHGLRWWELDISYLIIRLLGLLHLAWNIRVPDEQTMQSRRNTSAA